MNDHDAPALPRYPKVTKTLRANQPGTRKLVRRYGEALLCVRYREDARGRRRCTTVELVIDEGPVQRKITGRSLVQVHLPFDDDEVRHRAKTLGARWDSVHRRWLMSLKMARALGLEVRALRWTTPRADPKFPRLHRPDGKMWPHSNSLWWMWQSGGGSKTR